MTLVQNIVGPPPPVFALPRSRKLFLLRYLQGRLGGSVSRVSAFGSGPDPRVLGWSPMSSSGSLLSGKPASPSPTPPACVPPLTVSLSLCLSLSNK